MLNPLRYFRRHRQPLQKREYLFAGVVWVHKLADFEQAAKVGQVIYRLIETTKLGDMALNEFLGTVLDAGGMAEMLEILLISSTPPKEEVDFRRFPAEDAWRLSRIFLHGTKTPGRLFCTLPQR